MIYNKYNIEREKHGVWISVDPTNFKITKALYDDGLLVSYIEQNITKEGKVYQCDYIDYSDILGFYNKVHKEDLYE